MDKTAIVILVFAAIIILAVIMLNKPQQQQPVYVQPPQPEANFWSSLGDVANILGALGVGSGSNNNEEVLAGSGDIAGGDTYARVINSDVNTIVPYSSQQVAASKGFNYLQDSVDADNFEMDALEY